MDYKEILKGIVDIINTTEKSDIGFANICTYIGENCPEFKESEDERVRKELIKHLKELSDWKEDEVIPVKNPSYYQQWASWLEKQKGNICGISPNSAWSEEDEQHVNSLLKRLQGMCKKGATYTATRFPVSQDIDWLKSIKERKGGKI